MAIEDLEVFSSYPAIFDAVTIPDIIGVSPSTAINKVVITPGGSLDPSLIAEVYREPTVGLTALNLGAILAAISPVNGLEISTLAKIQYQARQDGGAFQGNGTHVTLTSQKGFIYPESIRAQQDETNPSPITLKYYGLQDGSNPPMAINVAQNLTGSPGVAAAFKLGPVVLEGDVLGGVQSSNVNFGLEYKPMRHGGSLSAAEGFIRSRKPSFEIGANNMSVAAATELGLLILQTGVDIYFAKIGADASDLVHVRIRLGAGSSAETSELPVQGEGDAETRLMITGVSTVSVATGIALP